MEEKYLTEDSFRQILEQFYKADKASIAQGNSDAPLEIKTITFDLSTARSRESAFKIGFPFKSIYVSNTTDTSVKAYFVPDSNDIFQDAVQIGNKDSLIFETAKSECFLYWDAQASKSMTISFFIRGQFKSGSTQTQLIGGSTASAFSQKAQVNVTNVATLLIASNSARAKLRLQNRGGDVISIGGDNTVTLATGLMIPAGESILIENNTSAFYAFSPLAGGVLTSIIEET